jgi:Carboxypeptidase regulatory-like domain
MKRHWGTASGFGAIAFAAVFSLVIFLGNPIKSSGNNDVSGVISGYVYSAYNHPLEGARVTLRSDNTPVLVETVNNNGFFVFLGVLPGQYVVEAQDNGYEQCATTFSIYPNEGSSVRFRLPNNGPVCVATVRFEAPLEF